MHTFGYSILNQQEIEAELNLSFERGLSHKEARKRLENKGLNSITIKYRFRFLKRLVEQLKSPIIYILIFGAAMTLLLGEYTDSIIIGITLFLNVLIGLVQEGKASHAFEQLQTFETKHAIVRRGGLLKKILTTELVNGDVVLLESGNSVPADMRIIKQNGLLVSESQLTGEWNSVEKQDKVLTEESKELTKQKNLIWMGTLVTSGTAEGIVIATSFETQIGKLASLLASGELKLEKTPLQIKVTKLANFITVVILVVICVLVLIASLRGLPLSEIIFIAVAIAVAAMPEGLPAAMTVVLAIGMRNILKKKGLVKKLTATETLGSTTWIISDKTGTLTKGKTELVSVINLKGKEISLNEASEEELKKYVRNILEPAVFTSNAKRLGAGDDFEGDLIEVSVLKKVIEHKLGDEKINRSDYIPFDSSNKFSAAIGKIDNRDTLFITGAPELILDTFNKTNTNADDLNQIKKIFEKKLREGRRILGVAKQVDYENQTFDSDTKNNPSLLLSKAELVGLLIFEDPIREDVYDSIQFIQKSNIRISMATGDNPQTALFVSKYLGIAGENPEILMGIDMDDMDDKELFERAKKVDIYARMLPEHKLRLANVLANNGEFIAMTGDGVNDAPALKAASIGIAPSSATNVAKEAADLVLIDDSFITITEAIKEGRRIIDNFRKIVGYLLSTSFSEVLLIVFALLLGSQLPLTPAQILWANIVEETFIVFAFAFEKLNPNSLFNNPKLKTNQLIITDKLRIMIIAIAIRTSLVLIVIYAILEYLTNFSIEEIRTIMFIGISIDSLFFALSFKDLSTPIWKTNIFSNMKLIGAIIISIALIFVAYFVPVLNEVLELEEIGLIFVPIMTVIALVNLVITENVKVSLLRRFGAAD